MIRQKYGYMFNTCTNNFNGVILPKIIFWLLTLLTTIWSWAIADTPSFFLAYLSHWILIYAVIYHSLSLGFSLSKEENLPPEWLFKLAWFMFTNTGTDKIIMIIMFWLLGFNELNGFSFPYYMVHGGVAILMLFQGFFIDQIPVRLRHYPGIAALGVLYLLWTMFHSFVLFENPDNPDYNGGVYADSTWRDGFIIPTVLSIGIIFVLGPFSFMILWLVSIAVVRPGRTRERLFRFVRSVGGGGSRKLEKDDYIESNAVDDVKKARAKQEESMMDTTVAMSELDFSQRPTQSIMAGGGQNDASWCVLSPPPHDEENGMTVALDM